MEEQEINSKSIGRICLFFIAMGLIEVFYFVFVTQKLFAIIPGLITIVPAYLTLQKNEVRRRNFAGIWPLIKFNPIGFAMIAFIMGDFLNAYGSGINIFYSFMIVFIPLGILSIIFGILLIIKISRHNKFIKLFNPV